MAKRGPRPKVTTSAETIEALPSELSICLHGVQSDYCKSKKIYAAFVGGAGAGKSFVLAYDGCVNTKPGAPIAIISPTYRMLEDTTQRSFMEVASKLGLWDQAKYRKTDNIAILNNGTEVFFRSGDDPDKLSGLNLSRALLDEASLMREMVFTISVARLRWRGEQGQLRGAFTPRGKEHWTYRLFGDKTNPNVELFRCSTKNNPFISPEFYQNLLLQYGKGEGGQLRALQDLEGEFICVEGAEWSSEHFTQEKFFRDWPVDDQEIRVVSLDSSKGIGGKTGDYSCFAIVAYAHGKLWVEFNLSNTRNFGGMADAAIEIQKTFNPDLFGLEEEFGGTAVADDFLNRAEDARIVMPIMLIPTHKVQKEIRIRTGLTPYLLADMIRFRDNEQTRLGVAQMESFPFSDHDDAPDSLANAIRLINESGLVVADAE